LVVTWSARRSYLSCWSLGARFSTLNVATASWLFDCALVVSRVRPDVMWPAGVVTRTWGMAKA